MQQFPCRICGDLPVNSKLITCKAYIYFSAISTCISKLRIYGDFRQHVIPTVIMCLLRGTPCYTGFSYNFYGENICSVFFDSSDSRNNNLGLTQDMFLFPDKALVTKSCAGVFLWNRIFLLKNGSKWEGILFCNHMIICF